MRPWLWSVWCCGMVFVVKHLACHRCCLSHCIHVELHSLKPLRYFVLWGVRGCIDSTFVVECLVLWYGICS